jgi:hypothetical protein
VTHANIAKTRFDAENHPASANAARSSFREGEAPSEPPRCFARTVRCATAIAGVCCYTAYTKTVKNEPRHWQRQRHPALGYNYAMDFLIVLIVYMWLDGTVRLAWAILLKCQFVVPRWYCYTTLGSVLVGVSQVLAGTTLFVECIVNIGLGPWIFVPMVLVCTVALFGLSIERKARDRLKGRNL